jgi:3-deoxy-D-manno-octulosonate 8-phosphate phosphatase (KDO 8-P phosphatase)
LTSADSPRDLRELALDLKILLLDVDGVMTDGGIILSGVDGEAKRFDVQDGMGIALARSVGLKIGIITSRESAVVQRRAAELHIDELFQGVRTKTDALATILKNHNVQAAQVAYMGDDIQDIPIMKLVGLPIAVQNARPEVRECSRYVTQTPGGHGAVRDAVEWLLELRGEREKAHQGVLQ